MPTHSGSQQQGFSCFKQVHSYSFSFNFTSCRALVHQKFNTPMWSFQNKPQGNNAACDFQNVITRIRKHLSQTQTQHNFRRDNSSVAVLVMECTVRLSSQTYSPPRIRIHKSQKSRLYSLKVKHHLKFRKITSIMTTYVFFKKNWSF